jgi:hypothetical protein
LSAEAFSAKVNAKADVAQLAERVLGKDEVTSSILVIGSNCWIQEGVRYQVSEMVQESGIGLRVSGAPDTRTSPET